MIETENKLEKKIGRIARHLAQVDAHLQKQLSFKRNFLLSLVSGVGYAIGATLIAGIVIAILSWSIDSIQDVPILNTLIHTPELEQAIEQASDKK